MIHPDSKAAARSAEGRAAATVARPWYSNVTLIVSSAVGLGLLGYVASVAAVRESGGELNAIVAHSWLAILLLTFPYLAARALVWHRLLLQLGVVISWRQLGASLVVGEIAKYVPAGVYVQNYLLARLAHFDQRAVVRSTMATTAVLGLESALALPVALMVGIPHAPWLFWTLVGIVSAWLVALGVIWLTVRYWSFHLQPKTPSWLRRILLALDQFLEAGRELITVRTLPTLIPTAVYMLARVIALYAILLALGIHTVSFVDTMGIYSIIVLGLTLGIIPVNLGGAEIIGLAALTAYALPQSTAALVMLSLRLLASGMTVLVAAVLLVPMWRGLLSSDARRR